MCLSFLRVIVSKTQVGLNSLLRKNNQCTTFFNIIKLEMRTFVTEAGIGHCMVVNGCYKASVSEQPHGLWSLMTSTEGAQ